MEPITQEIDARPAAEQVKAIDEALACLERARELCRRHRLDQDAANLAADAMSSLRAERRTLTEALGEYETLSQTHWSQLPREPREYVL